MKQCLLLLVLVLAGPLMAQEVRLERTISWKAIEYSYEDSILHAYLCFKDAVYVSQENQLPHFFEDFPLPCSIEQVQVRLENEIYVPADTAEATLIKQEIQPDTSISIHASIALSLGKPYVQICFTPVRNTPLQGQPEKLVSFTMVISYPNQLKVSSSAKAARAVSHSILATGTWYKMKVAASGIYKLTYSQIRDIGIANPQEVHIYGNGGKQLPIMNSDLRPEDLLEIPLWFEKGDDGIFNSGDYILFYAEGPLTWSYSAAEKIFKPANHPFTDASYYFITASAEPVKTVQPLAQSALPVTHNVTVFNDYTVHEENSVNLIRSGAEWYGENFDAVTSLNFSFNLPNLVNGDTAIVSSRVLARYGNTTSFGFFIDNEPIGSLFLDPVNVTSTTTNYASENTGRFVIFPSGNAITVEVNYNKSGKPAAEGWLDYLFLNVHRQLIMSGDQLFFRSIGNIGTGQVGRFQLSNASSGLMVWDITDLHQTQNLAYTQAGSMLEFTQPTIDLREYVVFHESAGFPSPAYSGEGLGQIVNQDLHGTAPADLVIVSHPDFLESAEKLAELHRNQDGMRVKVVTTTQVYNEFSSGATDVSAIRDFMKMLYDNAATDSGKPRYLLLFGDGSFDNMHTNKLNPNFIPTYESTNSLAPSSSYVSDDFYALLDAGEGGSTGMMDIGVGRLPVKTVTEAEEVVTKIEGYTDPSNKSDWKNLICFVGDDEDGNTHMIQADDLASYVETNYPAFAVEKIYLDAYQQHTSSIGQTYPDVNAAIKLRINNGALIFNYTGHGNEIGLAHEKILQLNDIKELQNMKRLPLFVTATCEFSRFDDVSINGTQYSDATSAGEWLLLNPRGGGIALLSTTRLVYSGPNFYLNDRFYHYVFEKNAGNEKYRLGDIIRLTKNSSGPGINKLNFTLLGDPALSLAYPLNNIVTDSVNGVATATFADTLKAFTPVKISGHIEDPEGLLLSNASGFIYPAIYDKANLINSLNNDGNGVMTFSAFNSLLFKGKTEVKAGGFKFSFIIPRDINYRIDFGKVLYYASDSLYEAHGQASNLLVGGYDPDHTIDEVGPDMNLYMNDTNFISGGITDENPVLLARISDASGINTTGSGIGHDIIGILDEETRLTLNDFYQADLNSYSSGNIRFPLYGLSTGKHSLSVKVWDIYDNSSEKKVDFVVTNSALFIVENLLNFPNPVEGYTSFAFSHNRPGDELKVELSIFDLSGRCIKTIAATMTTEGYSSIPIFWNGTADNGARVSQGLYVYRIRVHAGDWQEANAAGKLLIIK